MLIKTGVNAERTSVKKGAYHCGVHATELENVTANDICGTENES
jgi:hypothetical protein